MRQPIPAPHIPDDPKAPRPDRAPSSGAPARIWLVRHAEVHDDWQDRAYGGLDVPLSAAGMQQTVELAARFGELPIRCVASSHLMRALHMGREIAENARAPLAIDPALREVSRGEWQGLPTAEFRARWAADSERFLANPWTWKGHGGESSADMFVRAWPVVLELAARSRGIDVVLTSHFNLIRSIVTGALGLSGHESFAFRIDTAHACLLVDDGQNWSVPVRNITDPRPHGPANGSAR